MRKLLFITALILFASITFSQPLQKGNLIGVHVITVTLEPDVTMDQFLKFFSEKYIPEFEKTFKDWKLFAMKGIRGEHKNSIGLLFQIKDEATRNLYNNDDGTSTELSGPGTGSGGSTTSASARGTRCIPVTASKTALAAHAATMPKRAGSPFPDRFLTIVVVLFFAI